MAAKKITIDLEAGTASFISGVDKAGQSLKHLGEKAEESHGFLSKFKEGFEMAGGFEAFHKGLELVHQGIDQIKEAFEQVGQIGRDALKLGISAEQMSRFQHAANATHTDISALTTGMDRLNRQIGLVASGDKSAAKAAESFTRLGLSAKELAGLSPDEAFTKVADALGKVGSTFDRAAISQEIFGRGGKDLIPIMGDLRGLMAESDDIGFTRTAENIRAAEEEEKQLAVMTDTVKGLFMDLATSKWATELIEHIQAVAKEWHYMMAEPVSQGTIDADEAKLAQLDSKIREVNEQMKAAHEKGDSAGLLAAEQEGLKILKEKAEAVKTLNGHMAQTANHSVNFGIEQSRAIHQQINAQTQQVAAAQKVKDAEDAAAAAAAAAAKKQLAAHKEITQAMAGLRSEIGSKNGDPFARYAEEAKKMKDAGASAADLAAYQKLVEALKKVTAEKKHQAEMDAAQKKRADEAKRIWQEAETPLQKYQDRVKELNELLKSGALSEAQYTQAAAKAWLDKAKAEKSAHDESKRAGMEQHRFNFDLLAKPLGAPMPKLHPEGAGAEANGIFKQILTIHKQQQTYAQNWDTYLRQIWQTLTNSAGTTSDTTAAI
ncbi:MAG TPA: hypothetical protein VFC78_22075 [Tepidisphaeraceae bacterium]|nr:hypothetical protein [Tepidisphaeraceae bacterium]